MKKRLYSVALMVALMFTAFVGTALAADYRASMTLTQFTTTASKGVQSGEIKISFDVIANNSVDSLGVSSIKIYKDDDTYVTTIIGTTGNGLIRGNNARLSSSYVYTGTSGTTYYAIVTGFASAGSDYDSRTVRTNSVKAP